MENNHLMSWHVPKTEEEIEELKALAEQGDARGQTEYGKCLLFGKGGTIDGAQAFAWFQKAAAQENEIAKMYVGHCLMYGIGEKADEGKAYRMLDDALNYNYPDEGESQSQANYSPFAEEDLCQLFWDLGDALEKSLGVVRNYRVAYYYFNMLADWGHPEGAERRKQFKKRLFFWTKVK